VGVARALQGDGTATVVGYRVGGKVLVTLSNAPGRRAPPAPVLGTGPRAGGGDLRHYRPGPVRTTLG